MKLREEATVRIDSLKEFEAYFTPKNEERPEIHGGLAYCTSSNRRRWTRSSKRSR